jgi:phage terminase small subunit
MSGGSDPVRASDADVVPMSAVIEQRPDAPPAKREKSPYESLKRRQKRFVEQYVIGCSGAEAMRQCGYKGLHPNAKAGKWLSRPEIRAAIQERTEFYLQDTAARSHKTIGQVVAIAYADPRKVVDPETGKAVPLEKMDPETAAAISSVEVENISIDGESGVRYKYRFWDKNKALDRLGQWQQLWDGPGAKVNVDARSVTVNAAGEGVLRAIDDLVARASAVGVTTALPQAHSDGPVLPAPVRDGQDGHRAPVDAGENPGGAE